MQLCSCDVAAAAAYGIVITQCSSTVYIGIAMVFVFSLYILESLLSVSSQFLTLNDFIYCIKHVL